MLFRTGLGILSWKGTGTNTLATRGLLTLAQIRHYHTEVAAADVRVDELGCVLNRLYLWELKLALTVFSHGVTFSAT